MDKTTLAPEALGERPILPHNRYTQAGSAVSLDDVRIDLGTKSRSHAVYAPNGNGETSRRLRRYGLALSRVKFPDAKRQAKTWGVDPRTIEVASRSIATELYKRAYSDDPSTGTLSVAPLARLLNEPMPSKALLLEAVSYVGTKAFHDLKSVLNPDVARYIEDLGDFVAGWQSHYTFANLLEINDEFSHNRRYSKKRWARYIKQLDSRVDAAKSNLHDEQGQGVEMAKRQRLSQAYSHGKPAEMPTGMEGWYPLFVSKPPLDVPHTGKLGRRLMYTNEGKYPRNIGRMITDPERRIFTRKTRSLGAVVVIDCSGSMNLTSRELSMLMESSAGATVVAYSTGNEANQDNPNCWVVARKGRQVRRLPDFPGGNGCDGPALSYGVSLRANSRQPVIWVSDGAVTGIGDRSTAELKRQCKRLVVRHGIHHVETVREAVQLMKRLQGGKK